MNRVLSQDEVDALLQGVTDGAVPTGTDEPADPSGVSMYDLTNQERIIRGRMPTLEIINQRFCRIFRGSISAMLRRVVDISLVSTDMIKFGEFLKGLPVPTSLHLFRMDPLRGFALLVVEAKLVFALVDVLFGGTGKTQVKVEGRDFTSIESAMIKRVVFRILDDLAVAWKPVYEVRLEYSRSEVNPQFAGIVPPSDLVVLVTFETEMEGAQGNVSLCIPYSAIEPIRQKLQAGFQSDQLEVDAAWVRRLQERLMDVDVGIVAMLGGTTIRARDLLNLHVGDVLTLDQDVTGDVTVLVEGIPKFHGRPGAFQGSQAIQVSAPITLKGRE